MDFGQLYRLFSGGTVYRQRPFKIELSLQYVQRCVFPHEFRIQMAHSHIVSHGYYLYLLSIAVVRG